MWEIMINKRAINYFIHFLSIFYIYYKNDISIKSFLLFKWKKLNLKVFFYHKSTLKWIENIILEKNSRIHFRNSEKRVQKGFH
jgi:hypothetical protein